MNKMVKRCTAEGVICKGLRGATLELHLALVKMREQHEKAKKFAYGYMAWIAYADVEAWELREKLEKLRNMLAITCYKCKGYNDFIHDLMIEAEMFVARQAFADAEARYEEYVSPEKYAEMFYE
ncbi:hypothetical protein [Candidatus Clostridium stratigraminis]|uniref:Uncharacterized protein n=1 Tax=Candidatus Clostridium stratigraminis TaxID=3381661 RepID=A0ABW8T2N0_9CLOT